MRPKTLRTTHAAPLPRPSETSQIPCVAQRAPGCLAVRLKPASFKLHRSGSTKHCFNRLETAYRRRGVNYRSPSETGWGVWFGFWGQKRSLFPKTHVRGEGVRLTRTFARGPVWGKTTRAVNGSHAGDCAPACKCHDVSPSKSICKRLENHRKTRVKQTPVTCGPQTPIFLQGTRCGIFLLTRCRTCVILSMCNDKCSRDGCNIRERGQYLTWGY